MLRDFTWMEKYEEACQLDDDYVGRERERFGSEEGHVTEKYYIIG